MASHIDDHLDEAWKAISMARDFGLEEFTPAVLAALASAHIQLWHAERIRRYEQAQEEWQRKQRENTPPPPPLQFPGYGGF